jgi:hypothetical protein
VSRLVIGNVNWVPVRSAAILLRVSRQRIHQLIASGSLSARKMDGTVLVSLRSITERYNQRGAGGDGRRRDR